MDGRINTNLDAELIILVLNVWLWISHLFFEWTTGQNWSVKTFQTVPQNSNMSEQKQSDASDHHSEETFCVGTLMWCISKPDKHKWCLPLSYGCHHLSAQDGLIQRSEVSHHPRNGEIDTGNCWQESDAVRGEGSITKMPPSPRALRLRVAWRKADWQTHRGILLLFFH